MSEIISSTLIKKNITPLQARFIIEYLIDANAKESAIRAGYSPISAAESGSENLKVPEIAAAIAEQQEARSTRTLITADKILHNLYQIANSDIDECFENNGDLKPLNEIPKELRKCIASVEIEAMYEMEQDEKNPRRMRKVEVGLLKKVKFWNKDRAQENLAKHLRLLSERFEIVRDGVDFKFPGVTEVFVDSPEALQQALEGKPVEVADVTNESTTDQQK